ncbi:MAG: hypothetical protein UCJ19_10905 [Oscillospiraceae bacterium]|nr:hypothetical protein [Oscillospiraceae bacterium]
MKTAGSCAEDFYAAGVGGFDFFPRPQSWLLLKKESIRPPFSKGGVVPGQSLGSQKMAERKKSHLLLSFSFALRFIPQIRL